MLALYVYTIQQQLPQGMYYKNFR